MLLEDCLGLVLQGHKPVLFIPVVMGQEKVQRTCSGASKGSGELIKLLQGLLVLVPKEEIDDFGFLRLIHRLVAFFYLVPVDFVLSMLLDESGIAVLGASDESLNPVF